jgi:hypothetical protein
MKGLADDCKSTAVEYGGGLRWGALRSALRISEHDNSPKATSACCGVARADTEAS